MSPTDLPLFAWSPPTKLLLFPMVNRVGRIRDVASKMLDKTTERHATHYRRQVTEALSLQLDRLGILGQQQAQEIDAFWSKVHDEMLRQTYRGSTGRPGGAA